MNINYLSKHEEKFCVSSMLVSLKVQTNESCDCEPKLYFEKSLCIFELQNNWNIFQSNIYNVITLYIEYKLCAHQR